MLQQARGGSVMIVHMPEKGAMIQLGEGDLPVRNG